jgi:hypothetical protein
MTDLLCAAFTGIITATTYKKSFKMPCKIDTRFTQVFSDAYTYLLAGYYLKS